jgi:hypothetical protein
VGYIRKEQDTHERRMGNKVHNIIVWRSREVLNAEEDWITRRNVKDEITVDMEKVWIGDLAAFSLDEFMSRGSLRLCAELRWLSLMH